jgi:hypothetical protein
LFADELFEVVSIRAVRNLGQMNIGRFEKSLFVARDAVSLDRTITWMTAITVKKALEVEIDQSLVKHMTSHRHVTIRDTVHDCVQRNRQTSETCLSCAEENQ